MKKILVFILLCCLCLTGCAAPKTENSKISIVSTIFPSYDFARQIAGDKADITMLISPGNESHSYEPTPADIIKIQNCDLFIYAGGESDKWVEDVLKSLDKPVKTLKMMDCVNAVTEETKEGMTAEKEEEKEYDEHIWTSPLNAVKISTAIKDVLKEINPENASFYEQNGAQYISQLKVLDKSFSDFFATVHNKTLLFGDRFPLRYFTDEFGLNYYAAFPGCSAETEPNASTIAYLIDKVKAENISTVFYIELSNHKVADSIAEATGAKTALFHTCHNISADDFKNGKTYISLMQSNLETLKGALN